MCMTVRQDSVAAHDVPTSPAGANVQLHGHVLGAVTPSLSVSGDLTIETATAVFLIVALS